jgi:hypothetical protein
VVLAEVATQADAAHTRVLSREVFDDAPRFVRAAILDQDDLEARDQRLKRGHQSAVQLAQERRAPVHGHDDRKVDVLFRI